MKRMILALLIGLSVLEQTQAQNYELKGFTLGKKESRDFISTTIGGVEGKLAFMKLKDKTISSFVFLPKGRIYTTDLLNLVKGLENKYGLTLKWYKKNSYSDGDGTYSSEDFTIIIMVEYNDYFDKPNDITVFISNKELEDKRDLEEQNKVISDF